MKTKRYCPKCGGSVSKNSKSGYCVHCVDKSGSKNPFYGKRHTEKTIRTIKEKTTKISKGLWRNPEYRKRVIDNMTGLTRDDTFKDKQRKNAIKQFRNIRQRIIRGETMKKSWELGKITPNIHSLNESKKEKLLFTEIQKMFPNKKIEKKTMRLGGKWYYPDVVIDNRIIIEFNGNYWHANPMIYKSMDIVHHNLTAQEIWERDKERNRRFAENGFDFIIVWENDFDKNKESILLQIKSIVGKNDERKNQNN